MTTIATDGKTMAADSMVSDDTMIHMTTFKKMAMLKDGSVFALAGPVGDFDMWRDFLNGEGELDTTADAEAFVLHHDGKLLCYNHRGRAYEQSTPAVTGSGKMVALGAMMAGASPSQAIKIASAVDLHTGGQITVMQPSQPKLAKGK